MPSESTAKLFSPTSIPISAADGGRSGTPSRSTLNIANQRPASRLIVTVLIVAFDGPVQFHLDVPRALHAEFAVIEQAAAVAVRRKRDAVVAPEGSVAWESRLLPAFYARIEALYVLSTRRSTSWQQEKFASARHPSARIAFNWFA